MCKFTKLFLVITMVLLVILTMCSWVQPDTVDVYDGSIQYADTQGYSVTRLSGFVEFYLDRSIGLARTDSGYLINTGSNALSGYVLVSGVEYPCRFLALGSEGVFQIQQSYYQNTQYRTAWITYNLTSDVLPSSYSYIEYLVVFLAVLLALLVGVNYLFRGGVQF